jgi:putative acetyltransferase
MRASIRPEADADRAAVHALNSAAFPTPAEADLVAALHESGDVMFSLVAEQDSRIVGHVLFSRLAGPSGCLALAPLAVEPGHQRQGIGKQLIETGIAEAQDGGWRAIFVLGDPAYYTRFGFTAEAAAGFPSPYAGEHFMARFLGDDPPAPAPIAHAEPFAAL